MGEFFGELGDELSLYVRYMAWLGTAPQSKDKKALDGAEPVSRLAKMQAEGREPIFPPNPAPHLVQYLMEMGPVEMAGMDAGPISWATLHHWQDQVGICLPPWQARLLRKLSIDYLDQTRKARNPDCPAPWGQRTADQRAAVSAKIKSIFGGLARNRQRA